MADKKVERGFRPISPKQKMEASLSDPGTRTMTEPAYEKGKADLVDKFRQREERWRTDQALRDQAAAHSRRARTPAAEGEAGQEAEGEPGPAAEDAVPAGNDRTERR